MALMAIMTVFAQTPNYQGIVYVTPTGAGTHSGDSWANATSSIGDAQVIAATYNSVVWVAAGSYYGDISDNAFTMIDGVNVYGGFAGTEPADFDLSLRDFEANETILDGDSARRVLYQPSNFIDTTIWDGFTIRNGYGYDHGGGVYLQKNGMVRNCHIHNNTAFDGGGVAAWDNSFVSNCTVSNNKAYAWGGGVFLRRNSILIDCQIFNNTANEKGGVNAASNSIVINCQIFNNTANNDSGVGVFTSAIVTDCQIFNNTSPYSRSVVASDNSTIIANCHIFNNKGGVMVLDGATITDCQIVNNMGGMGASDSSTIANCVLSGHTAENGIGVHNSTMTNCLISNNDSLRVVINHGIITNSTIVKNKFLHINSDDFGEITNSIVWGNDEFILRFLFVTYSVIEGDYQYLGENSNIYISNVDIFVNPSLTTGTSDSTANVDWHLREDAICINRGNNAAVIGSVDLDGNPRIQCDTVDMGCYEYHCSNTGIAHHNHDAATSLHLYPNPTSDLVNVKLTMNNEQLEGVEIQLFDVYGRLLNIVETGRAPSSQTTQIDLSRYAKGVYFVKAVSEGKVIAVRKVVKR